MLSRAPKGRIAPAEPLSPGDDRLLRRAFGRYGGKAAARADAVDVVRRAQIEAGGHWLLCDCRPALERPPALVPVLETYLRRHTQAGWPAHAEACEFFREPAEQAEITASYAPLPRPRVRLVRAFERGATEPVLCLEPASAARGRSQLARLLTTLMDQAGLQRIGPIGPWPPPMPEQLRRIWPVARAIFVDRGMPLSDVLCVSLAGLPALMEKIATARPDTFPRTRPHGLLLLRLADARAGELVALNGHALPVVGRVAVFGEAPEDEPDAPGARAPYLALCLVARPAPNDPVQICAAYAHPCASADRLLLVDSDLERATLNLLLAFRARMARSGLAVGITKPLQDLAPPREAGAPAGPPLIPDFVVTAGSAGGEVRRAVVETMGYRDAGYRERKLRLHPQMQAAVGAAAVIEHDFHQPAHWRQDWRDNRLGRELWKVLAGANAQSGSQGRTSVPEATMTARAAAPAAPPPA